MTGNQIKTGFVLALGLALMGPAWAPAAGLPSASPVSGSITSTIVGPLSGSKAADLTFGRIVRPQTAAGNGTVTVAAAGGAPTWTAGSTGVVLGNSSAPASFTFTGEAGAQISVSLSTTTLSLSGPNSNTLSVSLSADKSGAQTLSGTAGSGSDGTLAVKVGGSVALTNTTASGAYTANFTVSASYQ
jgi:hypothetical protein